MNSHPSITDCRAGERGLTFIEIVIVLAVVALLAGIIAPSMMSVTKDAQASKIISTYEALKTACTKHYADTGQLAREYTGPSYIAGAYHELAMKQTTAGWKGPYLERPLTTGDNPFSTTIHLYDRVSSMNTYAGGGFDLNGDGTDDVTTDSNMLVIWGVPQSTAEAVDQSLDRGGLGTWSSAGRVEWASNRLVLLILEK